MRERRMERVTNMNLPTIIICLPDEMLLGEHIPDTIDKPFLLHKTFFFKALCIPCTGDFFFHS